MEEKEGGRGREAEGRRMEEWRNGEGGLKKFEEEEDRRMEEGNRREIRGRRE